METLPLALQREILAFAAAPELIPVSLDDAILDGSPLSPPHFAEMRTEPSTASLDRLGRVCRAWRSITHAFCSEYASTRVLTMDFTTGQEETQQQQWEARLASNGAGERLLDLRIVITSEKGPLWWDLETSGSLANEAAVSTAATIQHAQWVDWNQLLRHCPNLLRLDLTGVPLHHFALGEVLRAASKNCLYMEALILPKKDRLHAEAVDATIDDTFIRLFVALEHWYKGPGPGLRQLTVPSRTEFDRERASDEFLGLVMKFCPRMEYLDGWKCSYTEKARLVASDESLCLSREIWTSCCNLSSNLREFSWVVVPFSDEFFLPFGKSPKPRLTRLQLTYNTRAPFRIRRNEYSTRGLCMLVRGCPALEHLDVVLHRLQPCDALIYPQVDEMIDADVFNDNFLVELTEHCPNLRSLRIRELGTSTSSRASSSLPVNAITDKGLSALSRARNLACIDIRGVKCSAAAIVGFLEAGPGLELRLNRRSVRFRELGVRFGDVVRGVLTDLATSAQKTDLADKLATMRLSISISSRRGYVFERSWLEGVQRSFQSRFPSGQLRFMAFVVNKKDKSLHSRSNDQEAVANLLARAGVKSDVTRIGRLVLYTAESALDERVRCKLESRASPSDSWIVAD